MKLQQFAISLLLTAFCVQSAFATDRASAATAVTVVARTVVEKKLVNADARRVLRLALETGRATLGDMTCDRALGSDFCLIDVAVLDDETTEEAEETLYRLRVSIREGKVVSARWELIAG